MIEGAWQLWKKNISENYTFRFFPPKYVKLSKWTAKAHVVLISLAFFSLNKRYNVKIMHLFANFFLRKWVQRTFVIISLQLYRALYFFFIKMSKINVKLKKLNKILYLSRIEKSLHRFKNKIAKTDLNNIGGKMLIDLPI